MVRAKVPSTSILSGTAILMAVGVGAAILVGGTITLLAPGPAQALPAYAAQTGFPCGKCHVNPAGGGERNAFGKAFAANGHKLPGK
ncbi:MAG: hypothetical protein ABSC37_01855 [Xanthobacteraceae bacterium]